MSGEHHCATRVRCVTRRRSNAFRLCFRYVPGGSGVGGRGTGADKRDADAAAHRSHHLACEGNAGASPPSVAALGPSCLNSCAFCLPRSLCGDAGVRRRTPHANRTCALAPPAPFPPRSDTDRMLSRRWMTAWSCQFTSTLRASRSSMASPTPDSSRRVWSNRPKARLRARGTSAALLCNSGDRCDLR